MENRKYEPPKMKVVALKRRASLLEESGLYHGPGAFNTSVELPDDAKV